MTEIICSWLNDDLRISQFIDENNFATAFSNGFLIGEILRKYDLMDNFDKLSKKSSAEAKLNNFILLEPTLKLLGIQFNNAIAKDLMESKFSILINLMYQLFIALENKKKSNTTTLSMQTMQAPATTQLQAMETVLYQQRLKKITPRQSDMDLKDLIKKYQDHQQTMQMKAERDRLLSAEGHKEETEKHRQNRLNRSKFLRDEQFDQMKRIEAAVVQIPKPPPNKSIDAIRRNKQLKMKKEAEIALKELDEFEKKQRNIIGRDQIDDVLTISREESFSISDGGMADDGLQFNGKSSKGPEDLLEYIQPKNNNDYVNRIRTRLENDKESRIAREKRRRKVLINCLKSHHQQEENERENMIAMRLMRQSQMERRIAVQLLQLRHEKDVIKSNRMDREQQYQKRREIEFINALEKERELIRQMKLVNMDNLKAEQELYDMKKAQHKMARYRKHYEMAEKIISDIVDYSCKISEFKALTDGNVPQKLIREWKLAFFNGVPIFDEDPQLDDEENVASKQNEMVVIQDISVPIDRQSSTVDKNDRQKKLDILDEDDIMEYKQLIGEWELEDGENMSTNRRNNILEWVVDRLQVLSNPIDIDATMPVLPSFPIKVAVVGKCFSGKSMLIKNLVKNNRCVSIIPQYVISDALRAYEENEEIEVEIPATIDQIVDNLSTENNKIDEDKTENQVIDINLNASINQPDNSLINGLEMTNRSGEKVEKVVVLQTQPSPRAILGQKIQEELMNGGSVNDQLLVDVIIEYIRRIPEGTGWIIDDFPATYEQAKLFEKCATGYEEPSSKASTKKAKQPSIQKEQNGLDALILLNTSDSDCLARAMTCSENQLNDLSNNTNVSKDIIANLQTSLTNFAEHWPKLSKFYSRINEKMIRSVDSNQNMTSTQVYLQVEMILDNIIKQKERPKTPPEIVAPIVTEIEPVLPLVIEDIKPEVDVTKDVPKKSSGRKSKSKSKSKSSSRASSAGSKSSDKKASSRKSRSKSKTESANSKGDKKVAKKDVSSKKDADSKIRKESKGSKDSKASKGSKGSKGSKTSSKGSRTGSGKRKKSKNAPSVEVVKADESKSLEIVEPLPGDSDWVYAEKPLDQNISKVFYNFWESLNEVYVNNCKHVFREVRFDREEIIRYLHAVRTAFRQFLDRPDAKQEYIDQFQKDFNEITDDWRDDEEVQQELHQRITELKEQLLEISQENQTDAETEMEKLKTNRWIEDRVGLVSNQYLNLMQSEFDRFQDVIRLLRDYYKLMISSQLDEFKPEFLRLPLIEIPTPKDETPEQQNVNIESSKTPLPNAPANPANKKGAAKAGGKPQAGENQGVEDTKELTEEEIEAMFKTKIPLVDYKTPGPQITSAILSSIPASGKQVKGDKSGGMIVKLMAAAKTDKKTDKQPDTIPLPDDLDERLLCEALQSCYSLAAAILDLEMSHASNQKDEADKQPAANAADKGKADKKGKGGKKSRTPTPKKGTKDKTATNTSAKSRSRSGSAKKSAAKGKGKGKTTPSKEVAANPSNDPEETEEAKKNKLFLEKAKLEYVAALQKEMAILRMNIMIIVNKGTKVIRELKGKVDSIFQTLSVWIADKLLKEDMSIKEIENVFRYHVEIKKPLKEKAELINHKFYLNPYEDSSKKPIPIIRPPSIDQVDEKYFTISQLKAFYHLFQLITDPQYASISIIDFNHFVNESLAVTDTKSLPGFIAQSTNVETSIAKVADAFSCDKEYVNWRLFLLSCSEPWPWPTQIDLLNLLFEFKELDQQNTGFVTKEQYDFVELWFSIPTTPSSPVDPSTPKIINRKSEIKKLFFDIFKTQNEQMESQDYEPTTQIEYLDYVQMLLHFAIFCTNNFYSGILRALSVTIGEHLPHIPVTFKDIQIPFDEDAEIVPETSEDVLISIHDMYKVLSFGHRKTISFDDDLENADLEDSESERDTTLIKSLKSIYESVQENEGHTAKFSNLLKHEGLLEWFAGCQWFRHVDLRSFFTDTNESVRVSADV